MGKTTLAQMIVARMASVNMAGCYTAEIRCTGSRLGFELQGLNGGRRTLAHVEIDSLHRVGRYRVDKDGFEEFLATLDLLNPGVELIVIDKIGKMELFSNRFRNLVCDALNADKQVLATIPLKGTDFIREIKQRSDIHLLEVTHANRDRLPEAIVKRKNMKNKILNDNIAINQSFWGRYERENFKRGFFLEQLIDANCNLYYRILVGA